MSLPHKDVFTAVNGQMIASLADNQRTDEARTSNTFLNWLFGQRRHRDATLPAGASILFSMMIVNMELSRYELERATDVFTNESLFEAAHLKPTKNGPLF